MNLKPLPINSMRARSGYLVGLSIILVGLACLLVALALDGGLPRALLIGGAVAFLVPGAAVVGASIWGGHSDQDRPDDDTWLPSRESPREPKDH